MLTPTYTFVYNSLKDKILGGEYPINSLLPAEPVLEKIYGVSRITVRRAVSMLSEDGLVMKKRGVGTVVLNYEITQNLNQITSLTETLHKKGYEVSVIESSIEYIEADVPLARIFDVPEKTKIAKLYRLIGASGMPLGIVENYIPAELVPDIDKWDGKFMSLYHLLEDKYYIQIEMAQDRIFAENAVTWEANKLQVEEGFALIGSRRKCVRFGKCIVYDIVRIRHDMYGFDISLYGRK